MLPQKAKGELNMKSTNVYKKSTAQIHLENILHHIKAEGITISQLKEISKHSNLYNKFNTSLIELINVLVHEKSAHDLITSIAQSYCSVYYPDMKGYDTLFEVISQTYLGLFSVIRKSSPNRGRIRIDTYLDKDPEVFTYTLRAYIQHNILLDLARKYGYNAKHTEPVTVSFDEDAESINKLDSVNYIKNQIENGVDMADQVISKIIFEDDMHALVDAVFDRFSARKPVAGYISLCILNECYDARTVVADLKSKDFNQLFLAVLNELSHKYNLDISKYTNATFDADKYISSFKSISDESARDRIDRLASQTRKDINKLPVASVIKSHHM